MLWNTEIPIVIDSYTNLYYAIIVIEQYEFLISGEAEAQVNAFISEEHSLKDYKTVS